MFSRKQPSPRRVRPGQQSVGVRRVAVVLTTVRPACLRRRLLQRPLTALFIVLLVLFCYTVFVSALWTILDLISILIKWASHTKSECDTEMGKKMVLRGLIYI